MRKNDLRNVDMPKSLLQDDGRLLADLINQSCQDLLARMFPHTRTSSLLDFDDAVPTVSDIRKLVQAYGTKQFRRRFQHLISQFDVNIQLSTLPLPS